MKETRIEVGSILSSRTKQGMVELTINGERAQMDLDKAREVRDMLLGGIEAAITDTLDLPILYDQSRPRRCTRLHGPSGVSGVAAGLEIDRVSIVVDIHHSLRVISLGLSSQAAENPP